MADYDTVIAATAASIGSSVTYLSISGYSSVGDSREILTYRKVSAAPTTHQLYFQSADGAYWEYVHGPRGVNVIACGMTVVASSTTNAAAWAKAQVYAQHFAGTTSDIFIDVLVPPGTYFFSSRITWDPSLGGVDAYGARFSFSPGTTTAGIKVQESNPEDGSPYRNARSVMRGLSIGGAGETGSAGINVSPISSSTAHCGFRDCDVYNFQVGVVFSANAYLLDFDHCNIYQNAYGVSDQGQQDNSGENISFNFCSIFNNSVVGVRLWNGNSSYRFSNCSIDYNAPEHTSDPQMDIQAANASFFGCHLEATSQRAFVVAQNPAGTEAHVSFHGCTFIQQEGSGSTEFLTIGNGGNVSIHGGYISFPSSTTTSPAIRVLAVGRLFMSGVQNIYPGTTFVSAASGSYFSQYTPVVVP